jgi:aspartate kinase
MIVMKFGGTSLRDAACIHTVHDLVRKEVRRRPVVVASAHSGVTNALVELAKDAVGAKVSIDALRERHRTVLHELGLPLDLHEPLLAELEDLLRGIHLVGEATPRSTDYVLSFGERLSVRTLAAFFVKQGTRAVALDSFDAGLVTDSRFGRARPLPDDGRIKAILSAVEGIPIVTGYIGRDEKGNVTTLGRNGSDYSAAIFGNALDAEEIQIWTDVDGVMTADPNLVKDARPIDRMSFDEASELAWYGGKVLHPSTILPAMEKKIPVRVLNTHRPDSRGTLIVDTLEEPGVVVRSIANKSRTILVTIVSTRMFLQHGFLARIFEVFDRHEIVIDMVATTEISVSVTTDSQHNLEAAVAELSSFSEVHVERDVALVCIVGHRIATELGVPGEVFETMRDERIRVRMISQGAIKVNISFVVPSEDVARAVNALHRRFFGS